MELFHVKSTHFSCTTAYNGGFFQILFVAVIILKISSQYEEYYLPGIHHCIVQSPMIRKIF